MLVRPDEGGGSLQMPDLTPRYVGGDQNRRETVTRAVRIIRLRDPPPGRFLDLMDGNWLGSL